MEIKRVIYCCILVKFVLFGDIHLEVRTEALICPEFVIYLRYCSGQFDVNTFYDSDFSSYFRIEYEKGRRILD